MRTIALLLALTPLVAAAEVPRQEPARCNVATHKAQSEVTQPPRARPLIEMPDARPVLTVYRQVDGCTVLLVREDGRIVEEPVGRPEARRVFKP